MIRVNLTPWRCRVCRAPVRQGSGRYCDPCADEVRAMQLLDYIALMESLAACPAADFSVGQYLGYKPLW